MNLASGRRGRQQYRSLTAEATATTTHNQPIGLTGTTGYSEVEASDLGLSLN
jgi:hypothetical protein